MIESSWSIPPVWTSMYCCLLCTMAMGMSVSSSVTAASTSSVLTPSAAEASMMDVVRRFSGTRRS